MNFAVEISIVLEYFFGKEKYYYLQVRFKLSSLVVVVVKFSYELE